MADISILSRAEGGTGEVCSIQHYVIKFINDLPQVCGFFRVLMFPPPIKLDRHDITEILLKVVLNNIIPNHIHTVNFNLDLKATDGKIYPRHDCEIKMYWLFHFELLALPTLFCFTDNSSVVLQVQNAKAQTFCLFGNETKGDNYVLLADIFIVDWYSFCSCRWGTR